MNLLNKVGIAAITVVFALGAVQEQASANNGNGNGNGNGKGNGNGGTTTSQADSSSSTQTENPLDAVSSSSGSTSSYDILGKVTGTTKYTISDEFQDSVSPNKPLTVNEGEGFFGLTDWMFGGKIGSNAGYDGPQGGQSGSWDISKAIEDNWGDIMLVFKSGQGTTLVGYQLADGVESGTWKSPYEKAALDFNGGNIKDVSHISVYYREGKKQVKRKVPEPSSILGLVAVSGLVGSSLKRKRKSSNIELV